MKLTVFKKVIELLKDNDDKSVKLLNAGIDCTNFNNELHSVISHLFGSIYGKNGKDWIDWWCFEKEWGTREDFTATDENGNKICESVEDLWEYVEKNKEGDYDIPKELTAEERLDAFRKIFGKC